MLNMIVAMTMDGIIGKDNKLPWHYPEDLKHFQETTMGSIVVMGRKTWDSLPENMKPLSGRINMVLTNDENWRHPGAYRTTFGQVMKLRQKNLSVFIIGGAEIYKQFFNVTDRLFLTLINKKYEGDSNFPYKLHEITNKFDFMDGKRLVETEVMAYEMRSTEHSSKVMENKIKKEIKIL